MNIMTLKFLGFFFFDSFKCLQFFFDLSEDQRMKIYYKGVWKSNEVLDLRRVTKDGDTMRFKTSLDLVLYLTEITLNLVEELVQGCHYLQFLQVCCYCIQFWVQRSSCPQCFQLLCREIFILCEHLHLKELKDQLRLTMRINDLKNPLVYWPGFHQLGLPEKIPHFFGT